LGDLEEGSEKNLEQIFQQEDGKVLNMKLILKIYLPLIKTGSALRTL